MGSHNSRGRIEPAEEQVEEGDTRSTSERDCSSGDPALSGQPGQDCPASAFPGAPSLPMEMWELKAEDQTLIRGDSMEHTGCTCSSTDEEQK